MSSYISFSLFGTDPIYTVGALRNAELAKTVYPGWRCIFWMPKKLMNSGIASKIDACGNSVFRDEVDAKGVKNQMFWRFLVADLPDCDRFIVRDTDSRLSTREANAVAEWAASPYKFHSLRDHPAHTLPLGGGLWGAAKGAFPNMREAIIKSGLANQPYERQSQYGADQTFLSTVVWPVAKRSCLEHDSCNRHIYPSARPFPDGCRFSQDRFTGEIVGESEQPHFFHWQQRCNFQTP
jgi:hypothetical protein